MSETLLGKESRERRLEGERRELLERELLERERRELLERERRDRLEKERAELLSEKEGFTIRESCHIIGAGRSTIYEALKDGELAALKLGRRTIILKHELLRFLSELPAANFGIKPPGTPESRRAKSDRITPAPRSPKVKQRPSVTSKAPRGRVRGRGATAQGPPTSLA
jgi:excisionase family DNA binding protein